MGQVILIGHGYLGREMKNSAEMIFGKLDKFHSIEFLSEEGLDTITDKIINKIKALNSPVLIVADLFCGTPYNASCSFALQNPEIEVEIVSGMSLPLVLETASMINQQSVHEIAELLPEIAGETVRRFDPTPVEDEEEEDL